MKRYFIIFFSGTVYGCNIEGSCTEITDGTYVNRSKVKSELIIYGNTAAYKSLLSSDLNYNVNKGVSMEITNILELSESDYRDYIKEN